jgi:hypothetical protein
MLFSKAIQAVDYHSIRIVRMNSAATRTPKLNTRIRRSYDCMLSPPVSEIRLAAPANPLAFTSHFYSASQPNAASIFCAQRNEFITITRNLKNAPDVGDGINVIVQKPIEI